MATSPEKWQALKALFDSALGLDPGARSAFLREHCPDPQIQAEVERLLAEHDEVGTFLSTPVLGEFALEPQTQKLSDGELLAGRFRVVRFIAGGGMGEVYEADDLELHDRVAIKIIRAAILAQPNAVARFKREVHLARKVTHPNVCRIFDLFRHRPEGEKGSPDTVFISMEMLHGPTLSQYLKANGRMGVDQALPLVQQMASALAAAHAAGIVHRDFKPGNVILAGEPGHWRAVVTDFGLALRSLTMGGASTISTGGGILGTPAYMSPEQLEGRAATPASDIYALGLVMYEMVTGARPFERTTISIDNPDALETDSPLASALKRLSEPPTTPTVYCRQLDRAWQQTILRCLERAPSDRFATPADVAQALAGSVPPSPRILRRRQQTLALVLSLLALLAFATFVAYRWKRRPPAPNAASQITPRRSIAVLGFKNLSGDPETSWISTALAEELTTELSFGEKLRTIPEENVARAKTELSLADADSFGKDTLARLRSDLNSDIVIMGSYLRLGPESNGRLRWDIRVQDADRGETILTSSETGTVDDLFDLVSQAGVEIRQKVGVEQVSEQGSSQLRAAVPSDPVAMRFYSEGLAKLRAFDAQGAQQLFQKAIAVDQNDPLPHAALAAAWAKLGYSSRAADEAKKSFELSNNLSRQDKLWVEGGYSEATRKWDKAIDAYTALFRFFPDNLEYGLRLTFSLNKAGKIPEALATIKELRNLPYPQKDDPRIDIMEADVLDSTGDFKQELAILDQAANRAQSKGQRLLLADALFSKAWAIQNTGDLAQASALAGKASAIYEVVHDPLGVAKCLFVQGTIESKQGNFDAALKTYDAAKEIATRIGYKRGIGATLNNVAIIRTERGELAESMEIYKQVVAIDHDLGDKQNEALTMGNIGWVLSYQGHLAAAEKPYLDGLKILKEIGDKDGIARGLGNIAAIAEQQGNMTKAEQNYSESLKLCREIGDQEICGYALQGLGNVFLTRGDFEHARAEYDEALSVRTQLGEKNTIAESKLARARLSLEEAKYDEAEKATRETVEDFKRENQIDDQISAEVQLIDSLLRRHASADAAKEVAASAPLISKTQNEDVRLSFEIVEARVNSLLGHKGDAQRSIASVLAKTKTEGFIVHEYECRLALGEIEIASHETPSGEKMLSDLTKEARAKGYVLIANRAAHLSH